MDKPIPNTAYQKMLEEAAMRRAKALQLHQDGKTMEEIGAALGVTRQRASQLVLAAKQQPA